MLIMLPEDWEFNIDDPYKMEKNKDGYNCTSCLLYGTDGCSSLVNWLSAVSWDPETGAKYNSIRPCLDYDEI